MKRIDVNKLVPGLITAEDVYGKGDHLILPKHITLTEKMICRLEQYAVTTISIMSDESESSHAISTSTESDEKIVNREEIKHFRRNYYKHVIFFKDSINNAIKNAEPLNTKHLLHNTLGIIDERFTTLGILNMLQHMSKFDDVTYFHSINVALICNIFGKWMKLPEEEVNILTLCGLLHDIGKLLLPDDLVQKPRKLTKEEFEQVKQHTVYGYDLLKKESIDPRIINVALKHHERCDGTGYPNHLKGEDLDDFSMIVAIADVYDAMTSERAYRGSICPFQVIDVFETEGLLKYNPHFLLIFLERLVSTYINNEVLLSNGEKGRIVLINKLSLAHPVIKTTTRYIDLSKEKDLIIKQILF